MLNTVSARVTVLALAAALFLPAHPASAAVRLLYDRTHGQSPVQQQLTGAAAKAGVEIVSSGVPITEGALDGADILYLRAPSQPFTAAEKGAIVGFVERGGSLFLAFDEERRVSLDGTGVNDLIAPFGLALTADTPAPHNTGALAKKGAIHRADRELPYSGGRAVTGGTPFSFVLDKGGDPSSLAHGAFTTVPSGGRIVVLGDAMVTLFMGSADGKRLVGTGPGDTPYWGKDSAVFMEEVLAWLAAAKKAAPASH